MLFSLAWPLSSTQLQFAASRSRDLPKLSGGPGADATGLRGPRTSGGGLHIPASGGVERRPRVPATDCSELHFSAWTPLRRIMPHRRSCIAAGGTASVSK